MAPHRVRQLHRPRKKPYGFEIYEDSTPLSLANIRKWCKSVIGNLGEPRGWSLKDDTIYIRGQKRGGKPMIYFMEEKHALAFKKMINTTNVDDILLFKFMYY